MPYQPAILGTARLGNFRLGYRPAALATVRATKARITLAGVAVRWRVGSVVIRDVANDAPNTCSLTIDASTPPVNSQRIRITINSDEPRLLFAGALETVDETYEGTPDHVVYPCTAQDDTPRANRRIPLGYWENVSATIVAQELVAAFAPGFTTNGVQLGLPTITVHFEGSEARMNGCLRQIAKLIGGYFYWEDRDLHLFTEEAADAPDDLDSTPGRFLDKPHIRVIRDDAQLRTKDFGKGHKESTLSDIPIGGTVIPLGDVSMYNPVGGMVISESQILDYTGTAAGGLGALLGTTVTPTNGPTVTKKVATGLTAGDYGWKATFVTASGETMPGPATAVTLGGAIPAPVSAPSAARVAGGNLNLGVYKWKVAYKDSVGGITLVSAESASVTMEDIISAPSSIGTSESDEGGSLDTDALYGYKFTFWDGGSLETLPGPASTFTSGSSVNLKGKLNKSGTSSAPGGYVRRFYRTEGGGSTYKLLPGSINGFEDESGDVWVEGAADGSLGANAPTSSTANYRKATVTLPISPDVNVVARELYRTKVNGSTFYHVTSIANNTATSYEDDTTDAALVNVAPTVNTTSYLSVDLTNISVGPAGTTQRKVYRTAVSGSTYKLLTTIANNSGTTFTDTTADGSLGADAPTSDTSGLVAQTGDVPAGATSALVTSTAPFTSAGGWAFIGALPIRYTGFSSTSLTGIPGAGPGAFTTSVRYGVEVIAASMLTGVSGVVRALIKGAPIHIWVQEDDLTAQAALAAREGEGDGIIEHRISDERRGEESLRALCRADLAQHSRGVVVVPYATRDVKTKSGKPIVIDIPSPLIDETLTIQDVTIDQIDIAPGLAPRFMVTASNVGVVTVEDLLRRMASGLGGL